MVGGADRVMQGGAMGDGVTGDEPMKAGVMRDGAMKTGPRGIGAIGATQAVGSKEAIGATQTIGTKETIGGIALGPSASWKDARAVAKGFLLGSCLGLVLASTPVWDVWGFVWLNQMLAKGQAWILICGALNHRSEKLVVPVALICLLLGEFWLTRRSVSWLVRLRQLLVFGVVLELFIGLIWTFKKLPWVYRYSPSLVIDDFINIHNQNSTSQGAVLYQWLQGGIKVFSRQAFPSGHGFTGIYWALAASCLVRSGMAPLFWVVTLAPTLARLVVGAHWPSDLMTAWVLAWVAYRLFLWACRALGIINK
jgi:membrane-associated phospholipid phosphatase